MSATLQPRALVHRGTVPAVGVVVDAVLLGERTARERVLDAWTPEARVFAVARGYLVRWGAPRPLDVARALGTPVTLEEGVLLAAPLTSAERARLAPPGGSLVRVLGGTARCEVLGVPVEPSAWLALDGLVRVRAESLGEPPLQPAPPPAPAEPPARAAFNVPPLAAATTSLLARARAAHGAPAGPVQAARLLNQLASALQLGLRALAALVAPLFMGGGLPVSAAPRRPPTPPGWLVKLTWRVMAWTRSLDLLGWTHGRYARRLLSLFEKGDLDEALRHAIPLGGGDAELLRPMLGAPAPRRSLAISPAGRATSSMMMGGTVEGRLRSLYRRAFAQLERAGRIDEAAFVLAELLRANAEAVSFLEKHGRLRLAAELAEARALAPDLQVRQWLLAGDVERAVLLARRTGTFATAVAQLERSHRQEARTLRLLWAETLAEAGDFAGAVAAAWPVEEARALAERWMDEALSRGGPGAARLLVHKALRYPERVGEARAAALALFTDPELCAERRSLVEALAQAERTQGTAALARAVLRPLLLGAGAGEVPSSTMLKKLLALAGDEALQADLPTVPRPPKPEPLLRRASPLVIHVDANEVGTTPLSDAAQLPDGRLVAALGEAGVLLLRADGRRIAHLAAPAHHLVVSDSGERALALAPRGELQHLSRLDLRARTSSAWYDTRLLTWADDYDGQAWFVAEPGRILALDVLAASPRSLWALPVKAPDDAPPFVHLARSASSLGLGLTTESSLLEVWRYELPGPTLRTRADAIAALETRNAEGERLFQPGRMVSPGGKAFMLHATHSEQGMVASNASLAMPNRTAHRFGLLATIDPLRQAVGSAIRDAALVLAWRTDDGVEVRLWDTEQRVLRARLRLVGARRVGLRLSDTALVVVDDRGRLVALSLETGEWQRVLV